MLSDDGTRPIAYLLSPSGEIAAILVQDYTNGENRIIPFGFGIVELANDSSAISAFLE